MFLVQVADHITTNELATAAFSLWSYGCGIIVDALVAATEEVEGLDYMPWVNKVLDSFANNSSDNAYKVAHGTNIPWGYSIGDVIGLFPFAYVRRATHYSLSKFPPPANYNVTQDRFIATEVAKRYIAGWPIHWTDGTITRDTPGHWPEELKQKKEHQFVWADDAFMGLTLVAK
jgi:hypothetical protein